MRYFLSLLLVVPLWAINLDLDYKNINEWISEKLRLLDIYMSDSNESVKQNFSIRSSIDTIIETKQTPQFKFNMRANLEFPRTQKRLHLFIQDFKKQNSVDEVSGQNIEDSIRNTSFLFGLQYMSKGNIRYRAGIRFHKITPDPFIALGWERTHYFKHAWIYYGNELRYFLHRHIDNKLFANFQYKRNNYELFSFENSYRYEERPVGEHQVTHALKIYHSFGERSLLIPRAECFFYANNEESYKINYYYLGFDFQDTFYRKWLFYQIGPAVLWRRENSFDPSWRVTFKIGITFEKN
ncbi:MULTISPECIES: hypothetical protein [unclassified Nitratiruptor]|uniref:hypothetical protein n=1 Tax=unclassified Nitratiruptor TaxID=2624044 RepID=UPI00191567AB|nr:MULTISPECIES: hypothetical protein [unclassified Nitratiruptor]